jgi:hypothetical protein
MRYILLFSDGSIHVGANDEASPYLVEGEKNWRAGVAELARRVNSRGQGKITNLEIQSHGRPATIVVSQREVIDYQSVFSFGTMLKPLMAPGGLIEIMACQVASYDPRALDPRMPTVHSSATHEYWDGFSDAAVILKQGPDRRHRVEPLTGVALTQFREKIALQRTMLIGPGGDGLGFCLNLAHASGATVRASRLTQNEEYTEVDIGKAAENIVQDHPIMMDYDRFGDWEGPVWDFMPNGTVKYLGCNLPRHRLRFPAAEPAGPQQLTYNFREQGGQNASGGQRPQRMNRSPLPV